MCVRMIRDLVFDFDGLLIDSKEMYIKFIKTAFAEFGLKLSFEEIENKLIPSIRGAIEILLPKNLENRLETAQNIENLVIELTSRDGENNITLCNNVRSVLNALKEKKYNIYLLTNSHSLFINKEGEWIMRKLVFCIWMIILASSVFSQTRPVSTYSIVALDERTGELGVAVQSHWFSVGSLVPWAVH